MSSYYTDSHTEEKEHRERLEAAVALRPVYPSERFTGRGVVICGGGAKYFPCVYVCVRVLRAVGCVLPIEVWHLGAAEMSPEMRAILEHSACAWWMPMPCASSTPCATCRAGS